MLERRIRILYSDSNAKEQRKKWLKKLHREEIGISTPVIRVMEDISDLRISSREMIRLFEDTVLREDVYISYSCKFNYLLKYLQGTLRIEGNNKNIFKLLTLFILYMPDTGEIICGLSKEYMFILETAFLQYFCIGAEQEQKMKITYDELFEIVGTHKARKNEIISIFSNRQKTKTGIETFP